MCFWSRVDEVGRRLFDSLLRGFILVICLVAVVPLPRIECRCGAVLPHEHSALGFSPHHHGDQDGVPGWAGTAEDAQLKADSDLRVMTGLPLLAEFPEPLTVRPRGRAHWGPTLEHPGGVQPDPESPPPRR